MKKYKRAIPLFSPFKIAITALFAAIAIVTIICFAETDNVWHIICGAIATSIVVTYLFILIGSGEKYRYFDKYIHISFLLLSIKKLRYSSYSAVVISNASYNNGYGFGVYGNIPMQYKVMEKSKVCKVVFPFITLHNAGYPIDKVKMGMYSRDLFLLDDNNIYCLGICWFDSLKELLEYTDYPVYVLEDVYLRYKGQFDVAFSTYKENQERFYVIAGHCIAYRKYKEEESI